jgi:hypothetical protein
MQELIQLIYVSSSRHLFNKTELIELASFCQEKNLQHEITGLLLYKDGSIMQVIEGNRENIEQLYFNIQCDIRHTNVTLLIKEFISARQFPHWSMSLIQIPPTENPEFADFFNTEYSTENLGRKAKILLTSFLKI